MSGNAAITVSISSSATMRLSVSMSILPIMVVWSPGHSCDIQIHRLPLRVMFEHLQPEFPSQSAALHAAEGRFKVDAAARVDGEISGLHGACDAQRAARVTGPDRS